MGPSFSFLTIIRPIVEAAPVAHWLLDPRATVLQRVQRGLVYRWDSAVNLKRNAHVAAAVAMADLEMQQIRSFVTEQQSVSTAAAQRWSWAGSPRNGGAIIGGEQLPHPDAAFASLLSDRADASSRTLWNYLSATGHGTFYALLQAFALEADQAARTFDSDAATAGISVDSGRLMRYGLIAFQGVDAVVNARDTLMGWTPSTARVVAAAALRDLHQRLSSL